MSLIDITELDGCKLISKKVLHDERGIFSELFRASSINNISFIQDNFSHSLLKGTFRGLHFQSSPFEQTKLVHVLTGSILDFFVDIRPASDTYLDYCAYKLTSSGDEALMIPKGFAHGFLTLEDDTRVFYKVDNYYSSENDYSLVWNDSSINIDFQENKILHLSEKDKNGLTINEMKLRKILNER